ncbi:hypothetical protein MLD38_006514 [Melastoma candidum]|uniref:Uncharacterized protein n=1 Tax=Melastoma candidum TaxID=119954 RepID=A0ACB9RN56_9MYRT|nr:hypothetical protein MLD38_006514 [Melastoma candidum]
MLRLKVVRFTFTVPTAFSSRNHPVVPTTCDGIMSSLSHKDPIFTRRFHFPTNHPPTQNPSFPPLGKFSANLEGSGIGVGVRGCSGGCGGFDRVHGNGRFYNPLAYVRDRQVAISSIDFRVEGRKDGRLVNGMQWGSHSVFKGHSAADKIVVAVDVDEVLGKFLSALNRFIADRYSWNHSLSEYHVYEFFKIWNCSRDEADLRVHEFFKTSYFKNGIHPIPGAQRALRKLSRFCKLSVVTSRQNAIKDHTIKWIEEHYPGLFHEIHFGNHFALDGESKPKSEICRSLGAKVLIDDNPRYALECAEIGMRVLLFDYENSYPWCKTDSINNHPLVTRVRNWEEVERELVSLVPS